MGAAYSPALPDQAAGLRRLLSARAAGSVAITAASPHAGHSAVAADLALAMSGNGLKVLLVDARGGPHGAAALLGAQPAHDLLDVVRGASSLREASVQRGDGLQVVQAQRALALAPRLPEVQAQRVRDALAQLCAQADVVLLDAAPGTSAGLSVTDRLLLVTRDDPDALTRSYGLLKRIAGELGGCRVSVALNGVRSASRADRIFGNLQSTASQFLNLSLECMGQLPDDAWVQRAAAAQRPVIELFPTSPAALALRRCAAALLGDRATLAVPPERFPGRLVDALHAGAANY